MQLALGHQELMIAFQLLLLFQRHANRQTNLETKRFRRNLEVWVHTHQQELLLRSSFTTFFFVVVQMFYVHHIGCQQPCHKTEKQSNQHFQIGFWVALKLGSSSALVLQEII